MGHGARPAHPDHRRFGMIAEFLRYPFGAACAAERPDGHGDGLLDLVDAGFIRALQRRRKEGVGSERADADGVLGWPNAESSAGLKVPQDELAVLAVIKTGIAVGSFSRGCAARRGLRRRFRRAGT